MKRTTTVRVVLWSVTALAVALEIWGAVTGNGGTWTESLVDWLPAPVTLALAGLLNAWLPGHFEQAYDGKETRPMGRYAKAIVGALVAGLTAYGTALADGGVTQTELVGVAVATLGALGAVWAVPNSPAAPEPYIPRSGPSPDAVRDLLDRDR